jgi:hypothetical protein
MPDTFTEAKGLAPDPSEIKPGTEVIVLETDDPDGGHVRIVISYDTPYPASALRALEHLGRPASIDRLRLAMLNVLLRDYPEYAAEEGVPDDQGQQEHPLP